MLHLQDPATPLAGTDLFPLVVALVVVGTLVAAGIVLAPTSLVANLMAGLVLRATSRLHVGDLVRCEGHCGLVTSLGLFHVEIRTEDGDVTALPNQFVTVHPFTVLRRSETVTSDDASLELLRGELESLADEERGLAKRRGESKDEAVKRALADELERLKERKLRLERMVAVREGHATEPGGGI